MQLFVTLFNYLLIVLNTFILLIQFFILANHRKGLQLFRLWFWLLLKSIRGPISPAAVIRNSRLRMMSIGAIDVFRPLLNQFEGVIFSITFFYVFCPVYILYLACVIFELRFMVLFFIRYRIKLDVFDGYDSSIFVLNDAQVNELVGISCEDLLALNEVRYLFFKFWASSIYVTILSLL